MTRRRKIAPIDLPEIERRYKAYLENRPCKIAEDYDVDQATLSRYTRHLRPARVWTGVRK